MLRQRESPRAGGDGVVQAVHLQVQAAGLGDKATFVITTDHGFKSAKRIIRPNVALRQAGLLRVQGPIVEQPEYETETATEIASEAAPAGESAEHSDGDDAPATVREAVDRTAAAGGL